MSNFVAKPFIYLSDLKNVTARKSIYGLGFVFFVASAYLVIHHGCQKTEETSSSGYTLTGIGIGIFACLLVALHRQAFTHVLERNRNFITSPWAKFFNYIGAFICVILGWLFSEKLKIPISGFLLAGMSCFAGGIFMFQMLLIPLKSDLGLLDSSFALIVGLIYRDFEIGWLEIGLFVTFGVALLLKAGYEAILIKRAEDQSAHQLAAAEARIVQLQDLHRSMELSGGESSRSSRRGGGRGRGRNR